tara:strand:+ start:41 stop:544 length:504 start_codon:yes stop_codon:yes gene_type:complete
MAIHFANSELSDAIGETWRIHSGFSGDSNPVVNWERADQTGGGSNYNVLNESSGIFTFNQTGWYHCTWWMYISGNYNSPWNEMMLQLSWNNGSSWQSYQYAQGNMISGQQRYNGMSTSHTFSIPAISGSGTRKIRFVINQSADGHISTGGSSTQSHTGFTIVKIADQ